MSEWTPEARLHLDEYLQRIAELCRQPGDDDDEVTANLKEHVAAEVDKAMTCAASATQGRDPVGSVLLHEAAEVDLHARKWQYDARTFPAHALPADARE